MTSETVRDLTAPYRELNIDLQADHVPAPSRHCPPTEGVLSNGYDGIVVREPDSGAFIHCERTVEVRQ